MTAAAPHTPQAIANKEKAVQALALRKTGATYEQIAQALGYASRGAAHRAVQRLLKAHEVEEVDALRKLEDSRLDEMLFAIYKAARGGDLGAIDRILRIAERRAKLWGLDASAKMDVTSGGEPLRHIIEVEIGRGSDTPQDTPQHDYAPANGILGE